VINLQTSARNLTFTLGDAGFTSATATDLWTSASLGHLTTSYVSTYRSDTIVLPEILRYTTLIAAHGSLALKLSNGVPAPQPSFEFYPAASSNSVLAGGAATRVVNSTVTVVGDIGNGGTLTFRNVNGGTTGGSKLISLDYINADVAFTNTACSNCRNVFVSVNGAAPVQAQCPLSGQVTSFSFVLFLYAWLTEYVLQTWDILYSGFLIELAGFQPGAVNTVELSNPSAFAPDMLRIGVAA
jgi:alpha-galactosidase